MTERLHHTLAGASLGALVGMLLGLSTSPVVSAVVAGLATIVGGFLATSDRKDTKKTSATEPDSRLDDKQQAKTIGFSLACGIFVIISILVRTHGLIGTSPLITKYNDLRAIGFGEAEARQLAVADVKEGENGLDRKSSIGGLFSTTADATRCGDLNPRKYTSSDGKLINADELLNAFRLSGETWKSLADSVSAKAAVEDRAAVLKYLWGIQCP